MSIVWSDELCTGINEIDKQHRRIVEYINSLDKAQATKDITMVAKVITACVDYTAIHFAFEEQLQHEAGYEFFDVHRRVHAMFTQRIAEYQRRFNTGEDVVAELHDLLTRWLVNHIKLDDADYVGAVKLYQATVLRQGKKKGGKGFIRKLFG